LIKHDSDRKAMMERIFERQSKFQINELSISKISLPLSVTYFEKNIVYDDLVGLDPKLSFDMLFFEINDLVPNILELEKSISNNNNQNNVEFLSIQIFDLDNPIFLIILIPFAGFILIRYENEQIKFYQFKHLFTFIFVAILVSSAVVTPISISSSYWGYAFAEIDNSTEIISQLENSENILQENVTAIFATENSTNIDLSQITITELFSTPTISAPHSTESKMSLSDILTFTLSKYTNSTGSTISAPHSTESKMSLSEHRLNHFCSSFN
jgi:hypothetical protein